MTPRQCILPCALFVTVIIAAAGSTPAQQVSGEPSSPGETRPQPASTEGKAAPADDGDDLRWPRTISQGGASLVIYQPQIEKLEQGKLSARAAVAITPAGSTKESFGAIELTARTDVDKDNHIVMLEDVAVTSASFPVDKAAEPEYLAMLRQGVPEVVRVVPLEQFEANLAASKAMQASPVEVKNDPPNILFSSKPAILILIDGEPALRQVAGAKAMRVVNTRSLILLDDASGQYYLFLMGKWVSGRSVLGPWTEATNVPEGFSTIKEELAKAGTVDLLEPKNPEGAPATLPVIDVSTRPAELLQSRGEPEYSPVPGTNLLYMENTESPIFKVLGTEETYVLVSGRWFRSQSLQGPWAYVSRKDLPPDFAKIPPDSAKANVLVSVPGTPQAKEAAIANSIPQTANVTIADAKLAVTYDGEPKFQEIEGDASLEYAVNSPEPVILVKESKTFYCVNNGVWFYSSAPTGPWIVATSVPGVIYTIPLSSPIHYVTYVRIYGATPTVVYTGYTPGYMGTCVAPDGVVVYGTGYYYPAYVGSVWVGYPCTYGYGAGFAYGAATGFAFGFAAGAIIGDCWSHPYWGPCRGYGSVNINSYSCYHNWHGGVTSFNGHYSYGGATSFASGRGSSFNPYTGRASVGGYSSYVNRDSGNFNVKGGGASYNPRTGTISAQGARATGNMYSGDLDANRASGRNNTRVNTGVASYDNNLYASHDGNVYRHSADNGWQSHTSDGWQDASRSGGDRFSQDRDNLDSQRFSRDFGEQHFNESRSSGGFRGGGGGWGGFHGGFRGRR
jgi:hypothetical protein